MGITDPDGDRDEAPAAASGAVFRSIGQLGLKKGRDSQAASSSHESRID